MDNLFRLKEYGTDFRTEIIAGVTTFLATMYIIVINPSILSQTGMPFSGVLTATVLLSAFSSLAMGIYAKNPIVVAPGMGLNTFFTYSVVIGMGVSWEKALGATFWSGVLFIILSAFNVRTYIVKAIPKQLRFGIAAGIGVFITVIGFENAGFIIRHPATLLGRGPLNVVTLTFLAGLAVTSILLAKRIKGSLISGIFLTSLLAYPIGRCWGESAVINWKGLLAAPDFSLLFRLDLLGSLQWAMFPVIFAMLFTDMFDSLSTFVGVAEAGNIKDGDGEPRNIRQSLIVDGLATTLAGLFGSSAGTSYIESATGIEEGGRSGLTAVVCAVLFLPFMFFSPLLSIVPAVATAPSLALVGVFMMAPVTKINWAKFEDAIPAFLALMLIPLTYSITQGIIWGFLSWSIIKLILGKRDEVPVMLLVIDAFCILALIV